MNKIRWAAQAAIALLGQAALAAAPAHYKIELLADLPGGIASSQGMAINASGTVAGQSVAGDGYYATTWASPGRSPVSSGDLTGGGVSSMAYAINDAGRIAGTGYGTTSVRAVVTGANGALIDLGDLPGGVNASGASALNNQGVVVGYSYSTASGNNPTAVRWSATGVATELADLPGGMFNSRATAINDAGLIAGTGYNSAGRSVWTYTDAGGMQALAGLNGSNYNDAYGINEAGWVVGQAVSGSVYHAALWHDGQVVDLGAVGGQNFAQDVNNRNQIVGVVGGIATLWTADLQRLDLYTLVDNLPERFTLSTAMAINDAGQITGWGVNASGQRVGYVLTEAAAVPEPSSWALMTSGLLACGWLVRRRTQPR